MTQEDAQKDGMTDEIQDVSSTSSPENGEATEGTRRDTDKELQEAKTENDRLKDQLLRKAAEFENYKRRNELDWQNFQRLANERVLLSILPILDDLTRSLKGGNDDTTYDAFYHGVELIFTKLLQTLKAQGVEPIEALGKPFNVDEHDALLQVPRSDVPDHTVVEEVEKGYRLNDRVLRHAKVIVSSARTDGDVNEQA